MDITPERAVQVLSRTPRVLGALLAEIPDEWGTANYGANTYSPHGVLAHLIHGEQVDWIPRARQILDGRGDQPFDPYVIEDAVAVGEGKAVNDLLDEFAALREANLDIVWSFNLTPDQLSLPGTHPSLGPVTLGGLLAAWTAHDLHHIAQVCKAMAYQVGDAAEPWGALLGIVRQGRAVTSG